MSFPGCEGEDGTLVIARAGITTFSLRGHSVPITSTWKNAWAAGTIRGWCAASVSHRNPAMVKQWHNEVDPEFGMRMGDYSEGFVQEKVAEAREDGGGDREVDAGGEFTQGAGRVPHPPRRSPPTAAPQPPRATSARP